MFQFCNPNILVSAVSELRSERREGTKKIGRPNTFVA
jgi:hypothetical protein